MAERARVKFTDKKQAVGGIISTVFGIVAAVLLVAAVYISAKAKGYGDTRVGVMGLLSLVISAAGIVFGIRSFKEKEKYYFLSTVGTLVCGILFFIIAATVTMTLI